MFIDGGFRRGTDIFKALALGGRGVGIGRPYLYALSAFGQARVERVIDILRAELTVTIRQAHPGHRLVIHRADLIRAAFTVTNDDTTTTTGSMDTTTMTFGRRGHLYYFLPYRVSRGLLRT